MSSILFFGIEAHDVLRSCSLSRLIGTRLFYKIRLNIPEAFVFESLNGTYEIP